ncbi:zinc finger MYM-type protein 1-like [Diabrotica undecimpunctata]|uniref:zinc finger MYM-type protein 1-like n=1 Tax=Diabrotica undecimpunctata TaxID=50387 RepID=UPI003B635B15
MCGQHAGVQARIKEKYPFAHFVHCYAHQLNLIMSKACSENSQVRLSFGNLNEIPTFFKNSSQRVAVLDKIVQKKIPHGAPTRWNFNIRPVNVVFEHRSSFIECMEEIEESFDKAAVCSSASSIRRILVDQNFVFWLTFFHRIMPQVDVLYNALQKTKTDPLEINKKVTDFERYMNSVRNSIDDTIDQGSSLCVEPLPTKRLWKDNSPVDHRRASIEVCDIIINCANDRFAFKNYLLATSLLYPEQFDNYCDNFPDDN